MGNDDTSFDDPELPDPSDMDPDEDDDETQPCPHCNVMIYEGAEFCPNCHRSVHGGGVTSQAAIWIIAGAIICVVIVVVLWIG